jgi:hypothetical protein
METTANATVNQRESINGSGSSVNTLIEFSRPTHFAFFIVVNWQKERYSPCKKGTINPIVNAAIVGKTKIGQYFFKILSMTILSPVILKKNRSG